MEYSFLGRKGQVSIEWILLALVISVYLQFFIVPVIESSISSGTDVINISHEKAMHKRTLDLVTSAALESPNSVKMLHVYLPPNSNLGCLEDRIRSHVGITRKSFYCTEDVGGPAGLSWCLRETALSAGISLDCTGFGDLDGNTVGKYITTAKDGEYVTLRAFRQPGTGRTVSLVEEI